jgi:hypothetical protein
MSRPESRAEAALYELCVNYGYCGASRRADEFLATTADDPDAWVDAVLAAEGIEPPLADKEGRRQVREVICDWLFDEGGGRGTKSGLPRFPPGA